MKENLKNTAESYLWSLIPENRKTLVALIFLVASFFIGVSYRIIIPTHSEDRSVKDNIFNAPAIINTGDILSEAPERHLKGNEEALISFLGENKLDKEHPFRIAVVGDGTEKMNLALEIKNFLQEKGYQVTGVDTSFHVLENDEPLSTDVFYSSTTNTLYISDK